MAVAMFVVTTKTDTVEGATRHMRANKLTSRTTYTMWGEIEGETIFLTRPHVRLWILSAKASKAAANSRLQWIQTTSDSSH